MPFFLQGCCGNINPSPRTLFEHAQQHGEKLGRAAIAATFEAEPVADRGIRHAEKTIDLPLLPPSSALEVERNIAHWTEQAEQARKGGDQGKILHAEGMQRYFEHERDNADQLTKPFTLQLLEIT